MSSKMKGHSAAVRKSTRTIKKTQRVLESADNSQDDGLDNPPKKPRKSSKPRRRKIDYCKNGEPFRCSMCESTYINTSVAKAKYKLEKYPIERERNGAIMQLCVKCSTALTNLENKGPSSKEREEFEEEGRRFGDYWSKLLKEPDACRLYCSLYQTLKCGCIQNYINGTLASSRKRKTSQTIVDIGQLDSPDPGPGNSEVLPPEQSDPCEKMKFLISLLKESQYKKNNLKIKRKQNDEEIPGLRKSLDNFILSNRAKLKNVGICERGCQKVLCYSNNYLHKKPATSEARLQRTKGGLRVSNVFELNDLHKQRCCEKECCKMTAKNVEKLKEWRQRAQVCQRDMWKVISEMIGSKGSGANTGHCSKFITMVTGCCKSTVKKVYYNILLTKGEIIKPEHGMKRKWQKHKESAEASQSSSLGTASAPKPGKIAKRVAPAGDTEGSHSKVRAPMPAGPPSSTAKLEDASTAPAVQQQQQQQQQPSVSCSSSSTPLCYVQKKQQSNVVESSSGFSCSAAQPSLHSSLPLRQHGSSTLVNPTASPVVSITADSHQPVDYEQKLKKEIPHLCSNLENFESTVKLLELVSGLVEIQRQKETLQVTQHAAGPLSDGGRSASVDSPNQVCIHSKVPQPVPLRSGPTVVQSSSHKETGTVTLVSAPPPWTTSTVQLTSGQVQSSTSYFTPTTSVSESFEKLPEVKGINAETIMSAPTIQLLGNPNYVQVVPNTVPLICTSQGVSVIPPSSAATNLLTADCPRYQAAASNNQTNLNSQTGVPVQFTSMQKTWEQPSSTSSLIFVLPKANFNQFTGTAGQSSTGGLSKGQPQISTSCAMSPSEFQTATTQASAQIAPNVDSSVSSQSGQLVSSISNGSFKPNLAFSIENAQTQKSDGGMASQRYTDNVLELGNKIAEGPSAKGIFPGTVFHMDATHPPTKRTILFSNNPENRNHQTFSQLNCAQGTAINNPELLTKSESQFSPHAHSSHQQEHQAYFHVFNPSSITHLSSSPQGSLFANIPLETPSSCSSFVFDALTDSPVKDSSLQVSPVFQPAPKNSILCDILVGSGPLSSNTINISAHPNARQPISSMETLAVSESQRQLKRPSVSENHLQNAANESVLPSTGHTTPRQILTVGQQYGTSGNSILSQNDLSFQQGLIVSRLPRTKEPPQVGIVNPYISTESTQVQSGLISSSERTTTLSDNNQESDQTRLGQSVNHSSLVQHLLNGDPVRADTEHLANHTSLQTILEDLSHAISASVGNTLSVSDVQAGSITSTPSQPRTNLLSQPSVSVDQNNPVRSAPYQGQLVDAISSSNLNQTFLFPFSSTSQNVPLFCSAMVCPDTGQIKIVPLVLATDQAQGSSLFTSSTQPQPANQIACNDLPFADHMSITSSNAAAISTTNLNAVSGNAALFTVPAVQTQQVMLHQDSGQHSESSSMTLGLNNKNIQFVLEPVNLQTSQILPQAQLTGTMSGNSFSQTVNQRPPALVQQHVNSGMSNVMDIAELNGHMITATPSVTSQINGQNSTQRQSLGSSMTALSTHTSSSPSSVVFSTATVVPEGVQQAVNTNGGISEHNQPVLTTSGHAAGSDLYTRPHYQKDRVQILGSAQPLLNVESFPETPVNARSEGLNIFTIPINQTVVSSSALLQPTESIFAESLPGSVSAPSNQQRPLLPKPQQSLLQTVSTKTSQNCTFFLVPDQPNYPTYQIAMCSSAELNSQPDDCSQNFLLAAQQSDSSVPSHQFPSENIQQQAASAQTPQASQELPLTLLPHTVHSLGTRGKAVQQESPQPLVTQPSVSVAASRLASGGAVQSKLYSSPVTSLAEVSRLAHLLQQPPRNLPQSQQAAQTVSANLYGGTQLKSLPKAREPGKPSNPQDPLSLAPTSLQTFEEKAQALTLIGNGTSNSILSNQPVKDHRNSGSPMQTSSGYKLKVPPSSTNILGERSQLRNNEIIDLTEDSPPLTPNSKQGSSEAEKHMEQRRLLERLQNPSSKISNLQYLPEQHSEMLSNFTELTPNSKQGSADAEKIMELKRLQEMLQNPSSKMSNVQHLQAQHNEMLSNFTEKSQMNQISQAQILQPQHPTQHVAKDISPNVQILVIAQKTNPTMTMSTTAGRATQEPVDKSWADIFHSLSSQQGSSSSLVQGVSSQLGLIPSQVKGQDGSSNFSQAIHCLSEEALLQTVAPATTLTVSGPEAKTQSPRSVSLSNQLSSAQKEKAGRTSNSLPPSSCTLVTASGFSLSYSTSQSASPSVVLPSVSTSCTGKPQITSFVAFTRATNTPTDAVGPPNITVMSPSRIGARLRLESGGNLAAVLATSHPNGTTLPLASSTLSSLKLTGTNTSTAAKPVPPTFDAASYSPLKVAPAFNSSATPAQSPKSSLLSLESSIKASESRTSQKAANSTSTPKPRKKPSTVLELLKEKESLHQNTVQSTSATVSSISIAQPIVGLPVPIIPSHGNQSGPSRVANPNSLSIQLKNAQQSSTNRNHGEPQVCSGQATLTVLETNKPGTVQRKESSQLVLYGNASQGVKPAPHSLQTFSHSPFQQQLSNSPCTKSEISIFPKTVSSSQMNSSLQKVNISKAPALTSEPKLKFVNQTSGGSPLSFLSTANPGSSNQKPLTLFNQKQGKETFSLHTKDLLTKTVKCETGVDQADPKHVSLLPSTVLHFTRPKQIMNPAGSSDAGHLQGNESVGLKLRSPAQQVSSGLRVPGNVMLAASGQRNYPAAEFTQGTVMSEETSIQRKPTEQPQTNKLVFSTGQAILTTTNPILSNILFSQNAIIDTAQAYTPSTQKETFGEQTNTNEKGPLVKTVHKVNLTNVENDTLARMLKTMGSVSIHELNEKHLLDISRQYSSTLVNEQCSENLQLPLQEITKPPAFNQSHGGKSDKDHGKHESMKNGRIEKIIDDMYSRADDVDEMVQCNAQIYQKKDKVDSNSSLVYETNAQALVAWNPVSISCADMKQSSSRNMSDRSKMPDSGNRSPKRVKGRKPACRISKKTVKFSDQVGKSGDVEHVSLYLPENPDQTEGEQTQTLAGHLMNCSELDREMLYQRYAAQHLNKMERQQMESKLIAHFYLDAKEQEQSLPPGQKVNQAAHQNASVYEDSHSQFRHERIPERPSDHGNEYFHAQSSVEVLRPRQEYLIENVVVDMNNGVASHHKDEALWPKSVGYDSSQPGMKNAPQKGFSASQNDLLSFEQSHGVGTEPIHSSFNILSDKGYSKLSNTRKMASVTDQSQVPVEDRFIKSNIRCSETDASFVPILNSWIRKSESGQHGSEVHSVKQALEPSSSITSSFNYKKAHPKNHGIVLKVNSDCKDTQGSQTNNIKADHFHLLSTEHKQKKFDHYTMKEVALSHDLFSMSSPSFHDSYVEGQLEPFVAESAKSLESLSKAINERQQENKQLREKIAIMEQKLHKCGSITSYTTSTNADVYGDKKFVSLDVQYHDVESKKRHSSANSKTSPELARQLAHKNRDSSQSFQGYVSMEVPICLEELNSNGLLPESKPGSVCYKPEPPDRCEKGKDPLVSSSSLSRPSSQMEIEIPHYESHVRHRYPSSEFKSSVYRFVNEPDSFMASVERHRHPSNSQRSSELDLFNEIRDRQRNPSSCSLKLGLLDLEFLNSDIGSRSRHPSYSMEPFPAIRSRNPSGSSNRRSRPGSSSSDREFPGMEDLAFFSDIGRTRSRNSSGESLEPTVEQIDDHTLKLYGTQSKH